MFSSSIHFGTDCYYYKPIDKPPVRLDKQKVEKVPKSERMKDFSTGYTTEGIDYFYYERKQGYPSAEKIEKYGFPLQPSTLPANLKNKLRGFFKTPTRSNSYPPSSNNKNGTSFLQNPTSSSYSTLPPSTNSQPPSSQNIQATSMNRSVSLQDSAPALDSSLLPSANEIELQKSPFSKHKRLNSKASDESLIHPDLLLPPTRPETPVDSWSQEIFQTADGHLARNFRHKEGRVSYDENALQQGRFERLS